jgi:glycogen(starch) synthase
MRILMLGWEFPPFIAGGLGTACYGLTKALDRLGHEITFVLPKAVDRSHASHVELQSPEAVPESLSRAIESIRAESNGEGPLSDDEEEIDLSGLDAELGLELRDYLVEGFDHMTIQPVPAAFRSPYGEQGGLTEAQITELVRRVKRRQAAINRGKGLDPGTLAELGLAAPDGMDESGQTPGYLGLTRGKGDDYGGDLLSDIRRYAELCVALNRDKSYDVIHAHDWMTYPAGMAVARATGIPLVVHVHSTEFDRSGENVNQQVYEIERRGIHSAMRAITVSYWTRNIVVHKYGVDPARLRVVWNGIEKNGDVSQRGPIRSDDKIVLFLGRITMQKGPEYFIGAAKRVLEKLDNVKFIVAGSGDMATRMIELAANMGIGHKVLFTGFLRGDDVARVYRMADCYVMPSVSEPFGIAPLEAMSHDVPVIISKQSGVSEVLTHVLKVDFWDVDEMANKIIAVLKHPPLSQTLRYHGNFDLHSLTWDGAAQKCTEIYEEAAAGMLEAVRH